MKMVDKARLSLHSTQKVLTDFVVDREAAAFPVAAALPGLDKEQKPVGSYLLLKARADVAAEEPHGTSVETAANLATVDPQLQCMGLLQQQDKDSLQWKQEAWLAVLGQNIP